MTNVTYSHELANWLNTLDFNYFCTFTTKYEMTLNSARRVMTKYLDRVKKQGVAPLLFWVAESFELKDGYHTHALLKVNAPENVLPQVWQQLKKDWQTVSIPREQKGSDVYHRVTIDSVDPKRAGTLYCTKYVTKNFTDYDLIY